MLAKKSVGLKNLQKLGGKMISFGLAVPAACLYVSAIFKAISTAISTGQAAPLKKIYWIYTVTLHYIPGAVNPADFPSRILSDLDCTLALTAWHQIQRAYGPHRGPYGVTGERSPGYLGPAIGVFLSIPCSGSGGCERFRTVSFCPGRMRMCSHHLF